jgi:hypothetical protein
MFTLNNHLLPSFLVKVPDSPTSTTLITSYPLNGLFSRLYKLSQHNLHNQLLTSSDPDPPIFPSLLHPLISLPLHSLPRFHCDNHIPNDIFLLLLLQRKLRLPPGTCRAKPVLDNCGDHFFLCTKAPKATFLNKIRNSLFAYCKPSPL